MQDPPRPSLASPGTSSSRGPRAWREAGIDLSAEDARLVDQVLALRPERWLKRGPLRETFAWPGRPWVVKRSRGDDARDWWYERVRGGVRSPARREAETLRELARQGFPVPRALAWVEEHGAARHPRLRPGRCALVMEAIDYEERLDARLARAPSAERGLWLERLVELVARFHRLGWYHRDLYAHHLAVRGDELVLFDLGRARREERARTRWRVKDLAALELGLSVSVSRPARLRLLERWRSASGFAHELSRARLARAVRAKARRLAAHRPHIDPDLECPPPLPSATS